VIAVPDGARLRRTWPQRLLIVLMVVVMFGCFATAGALAYVDKKVGQLQQISLGHVLAADDTPAADDGVQNILVVGVDNDAGLEDDPRMQGRDEGLRSDTIMVLRIDPSKSKAALLSFPRDLYVPLGGDGGTDRINAALPFGGPDLLIRTITENFGIQINHYVQVNFAQFEKLVDVVGGVPISFDKPVRDEWTGLEIDEPGCITMSGSEALDYVRSRHFEYFEDGEWNEDPAADLSRISRQQDFIQKAVERAASKGLRNPITMNRLLDAGLNAVTVDDQFTARDIASLASRFRSFDPSQFETYALPVYSDMVGDAAIVRLLDRQAEPILDVFRGGATAGAAGPASVQVDVLNGTGRTDEGRTTSDSLRQAGFDVGDVGDASTFGTTQTTIRYRSDERAAADVLASYLIVPAQLVQDDTLEGNGVQLTTGLDYNGVRAQPRPTTTTSSVPAPAGSSAPSDSSASPSSDTVPETTPTTRIGVVPSEGQDGLCH
jgi:polyisoprenyl-teichoic acid--peptidoglycan teichoic acid transferase